MRRKATGWIEQTADSFTVDTRYSTPRNLTCAMVAWRVHFKPQIALKVAMDPKRQLGGFDFGVLSHVVGVGTWSLNDWKLIS